MITMFYSIFTVFITMYLMNISNPMKMSLMLVILSMTVMMKMNFESGKTWFAMNFYLLFMGGILIMFMIISSIMPSQKLGKNLLAKTLMLILAAAILNNSVFLKMSEQPSDMREMSLYLGETMFIGAIVAIISSYFFMFLEISSESKTSMRILY